MSIGPIQMVVLGFPDTGRLEGRIADELALLSDVGVIRIINAVFVEREGDEALMVQVSDLEDEQREMLGAVIGAVIGAIADEDLGAELGAEVGAEAATGVGMAGAIAEDILEDLPDGSAALVLVVEHRWLIPLRDAIRDAGGIVLARQSIGLEELISLGLVAGAD